MNTHEFLPLLTPYQNTARYPLLLFPDEGFAISVGVGVEENGGLAIHQLDHRLEGSEGGLRIAQTQLHVEVTKRLLN